MAINFRRPAKAAYRSEWRSCFSFLPGQTCDGAYAPHFLEWWISVVELAKDSSNFACESSFPISRHRCDKWNPSLLTYKLQVVCSSLSVALRLEQVGIP